jgi:hypothetical protein
MVIGVVIISKKDEVIELLNYLTPSELQDIIYIAEQMLNDYEEEGWGEDEN